MEGILEWIKNYCMIFLLLTVLTLAAAQKEYRKYIHLFVEIILVITLAGPVLRAAGKSEDLFEKISYSSFWQGLEGMETDQKKVDFLNEDAYISYYEKAIEADLGLLAENEGYQMIEASVSLNGDYRVEEIELTVAKQGEAAVIIGMIEKEPEKAEITALKEKIAAYYQITPDQISIVD